jgi:hypothetical protein
MFRFPTRRLPALPAILVLAALAGLPGLLAAQKADTLLLNNGDRIIGEVSTLANGLLEYKTDNIGTIKVKWNRVVQLTSRLSFEVELRGGQRFFGTLAHSDSLGTLVVALDGAVSLLPLADVVALTRIKQTSVFNRIDGYLDLGFTYAQSNRTFQLTSGLEAAYLLQDWGVYLKGDLFTQSQNGAKPTRRWSLQPGVQRELPKRWLLYSLAQFQQNQELDLNLRVLISPGGGRVLFRTNTNEAKVFVGVAGQREWYRDTAVAGGERTSSSLEGSLTGSYHAYRYDRPELDLSANLQLYPSISEAGRLRAEADMRARYELLKDFFLTLSFLESYDNRPPSPDTPTSDLTTTLSLSWKF